MIPEDTIPYIELEERLRLETLLADLSMKFVNLPGGEVDREIMDAQRRICELLDLDLPVFWQLSDEAPGCFSAAHFYIAPQGPHPSRRLDEKDYPWFKQQLLAGRDRNLPSFPADPKGVAGREASGKVLNTLAQNIPWFLGGSADLRPSNKTALTYEGAGSFLA